MQVYVVENLCSVYGSARRAVEANKYNFITVYINENAYELDNHIELAIKQLKEHGKLMLRNYEGLFFITRQTIR